MIVASMIARFLTLVLVSIDVEPVKKSSRSYHCFKSMSGPITKGRKLLN